MAYTKHYRNTQQALKISYIFFSNTDDKDSYFWRLVMKFKKNSALFRHWLILLLSVWETRKNNLSFSAPEFLVGVGLSITEASRSHSDTPNSVGLLSTSDRPDAETFTLIKHNTHKRQTSIRWRDSNPQSQQANDDRPTPYTAGPLGLARTITLEIHIIVNMNTRKFGKPIEKLVGGVA